MARSDRARSGLRKTEPGAGALPAGRKHFAELGMGFRLAAASRQSPAMISLTGKPFSAYSIAGASSSEKGLVPNRLRS